MPQAHGTTSAHVVLIDDRASDVSTLRETLLRSDAARRLHSIGDPREAVAYLGREGPYRHAPEADAVLLSADLADDRAAWVLESIRRNPRLGRVPVIVLVADETARAAAADRFDGAQAVLAKPDIATTLAATLTTFTAMETPKRGSSRSRE